MRDFDGGLGAKDLLRCSRQEAMGGRVREGRRSVGGNPGHFSQLW